MKKSLKLFAGILLSLALLVAIGITALVLLVNPNDYKPQLQTLAAKQNVELNIEGNLGWSFYPQLGIHAGKFSIKPPMKDITKPFQFDSLTVSVKLLPLLHRQIIVHNVAIRASEISANNTTIKNLLLEATDLNLDQRAFPLRLSLEASTTEPPRVIHFKTAAQVSVDEELKNIALQQLSVQIDDTQLTGDIQATLGNKPFLKVNLAGTQLDTDNYLSAAGAKTKGAESSRQKTSRDNDEFIPASKILALPGDYHFTFQDLVLQHLHGAPFDVTLSISREGVMTIKQLKAGAYGGEFSMQGTIDARPAQPAVALTTAVHNLNLEPAIKDYFQIEKTFASGDFAFTSSVTTRGLSWNQLMQAIAGEFSFASKAITLDKVDLTSSLDTSLLQLLQVKLPKLMSGENQTVMTDMVGKGTIQQGVMNNTSLTALGPCMQLNGAGTYNLLSADVLYHMGITFPSSDTGKDCAEINTRLKDISWPIICKGSLDDGAAKICGADKEAVQSTVAKSLKKNAGKKLENKLDESLKKKFGEDADTIKNSLKGLF